MSAEQTTALGRALRDRREALGLSLRDVEAKVTEAVSLSPEGVERWGVTNAGIGQIETGRVQNPAFRTVMVLCGIYNLDPLGLYRRQVLGQNDV